LFISEVRDSVASSSPDLEIFQVQDEVDKMWLALSADARDKYEQMGTAHNARVWLPFTTPASRSPGGEAELSHGAELKKLFSVSDEKRRRALLFNFLKKSFSGEDMERSFSHSPHRLFGDTINNHKEWTSQVVVMWE
jgi:hypothetical protein